MNRCLSAEANPSLESPGSHAAVRVDRLAWILIAATVSFATVAGCGGYLGPEEMLERGKYLSDAQRPGEAITILTELLELEPDNTEAYYLRALARERSDDIEGAINDYSAAIKLDPRYAQAYNNRAVLLAQRRDYEPAIRDFSAVLNASPKFALGYKNRGLAYHDTQQFKEAYADFTRAIQLQPDATSYFLRGNLSLEQRQYERALADYDQAIKLDDSNSRIWLNRAIALARSGRTADARKSLQEASQRDNEIISQEIVLALRSMALDPSVGLDVKISDVQSAVQASGWKVVKSSTGPFPFTITRESVKRQLFVALLDIDRENITIANDARSAVLDESIPKALLIAVDSGLQGGKWQFIPEWQPAESDVSIATLRIAVDANDPLEENDPLDTNDPNTPLNQSPQQNPPTAR